MNTLMYDLTEFCREMSIKDFRDYAGLGQRVVQRSVGVKREIDKKENVIKMNEWLEFKIKQLIKMKKRAEKLLDSK